MARKTPLLVLASFFTLSLPSVLAQSPAALSLPASDFLSQGQFESLLSNGHVSNQRTWEESRTEELSEGAQFVSAEYQGNQTLIASFSEGNSQLKATLNGQPIAFSDEGLSDLHLVGNTIIGIQTNPSHTNGRLVRYNPQTDHFEAIQTTTLGSLQQLRATVNGSDIRLVWAERTNAAFLLRSCVLVNNSCPARTLQQQALSNPFKDLQLSQNELVITKQEGSQLIFEACYLLRATDFSNADESQLCSGTRRLETSKDPAEIKHLSFEKPFLSWSQKENGIFEIFTADFSQPQPRAEALTTNSDGDQISSSMSRLDSESPLVVWENYSQGDLQLQAARRVNQEWFQWQLSKSLRYPQLTGRSSAEACQEDLILRGWDPDGKRIVQFVQRSAKTTLNSPLYRFENPHESIRIQIEGQLSRDTELFWRDRPTQQWKAAVLSERNGIWEALIEQALESLQLQVILPGEEPLCFQHLEITQEGNIVDLSERDGEEVIPIQTDFDPTLSVLEQDGSTNLPQAELSRDQYDQMTQLLPTANGLRIRNIQARSTLAVIDLISGTAPDANRPIWFHLLDSKRQSVTLGRALTSNNRSFVFRSPAVPNTFSGEVTLIATQIPDIRLASLYPEKTHVLPLYLYNEQDLIEQKTVIDLDLDLEKLEFSQQQPLQTLQSDILRVYRNSENSEIQITLEGKLYGDNLENIVLKTVLLPSATENEYQLTDNDTHRFSLSETYSDLQLGEPYQLILYAINPEQVQSTSHAVSFELQSEQTMPTLGSTLIQSFREQPALMILLVTLLIVSLILLSAARNMGLLRWLIGFAIILLWALYSLYLAQQWGQRAFNAGLITFPGQEETIQRLSPDDDIPFTLTRLDENLRVQAGLATRWTTISPTTWEFELRQIKSDDVIRSIRRKIEDRSSEQQAIASVTQLVKVGPQTIQFVTRFPDPLLPSKLTRLSIDQTDEQSLLETSAQPYQLIEEASYQQRYQKNTSYQDLPFMSWIPPYRTEILLRNTDAIRESISKGNIDRYLDPDPELWTVLKEAGYRIQPRVSTESIILITNRNSFVLSNESIISAIRQLLQQPELIVNQPRDFARLAFQIAPPGVLGYTPDLELPEQSQTVEEALTQGKEELGIDTITLTLHFPASEYQLARSVESLLQNAGINIIPDEISRNEFEASLLEGLSDLTLIPLNFDLADAGPFLDNLVDSDSPFNHSYQHDEADALIEQARHELSTFKRLELLQQIMQIIITEEPYAIPLVYPQHYEAVLPEAQLSWSDSLLKWLLMR